MDDVTTAAVSPTAAVRPIVERACALADGATPCLHHWLIALCDCCPETVAEVAPRLGDVAETRDCLALLVAEGDLGDPITPEEALAGADTPRALACALLARGGYPLDGPCDILHVSVAPPASTDTPLLDTLGHDLTRAACEGVLGPVIGRDDEIERVIETLCRRTKRNPALVGPAGVGKTAIVEGLALRIARGAVPAALRGLRLVMLPVTAMVASCKHVGEFEERMQALLAEAARPDVVLFIDEAHTMVGAGAAGRNGNDLANILKPVLARGEVACIAATTDEEYRLFIEADSALERRFQPIRVQELTPEATLTVLTALRDSLARAQGVTVPATQLRWIVTFAGQYLHNRHFPDKAIDILEQSVAYGVAHGLTEVTQAAVEAVAQRMVGMPLEIEQRLACLREALTAGSLLPHPVVHALVRRLEVTLRGFDLRARRPNAVLLLLDAAATHSDTVADTIAECLFGSADRVVTLDCGRFAEAGDLTMLLGSPPGYVGYQGRLPLHQVLQMPWCVLRCENLHACHPVARDLLVQGLREGVITLADGKHVYLCDTVVILTAEVGAAHHPIGFGQAAAPSQAAVSQAAAQVLGQELLDQADLLCADLDQALDARVQWLRESLLADLCARFRPYGVELSYDDSLLTWLLARRPMHSAQHEWERLVDEHLCPAIIPHLPQTRPEQAVRLTVQIEGETCRVTADGQG